MKTRHRADYASSSASWDLHRASSASSRLWIVSAPYAIRKPQKHREKVENFDLKFSRFANIPQARRHSASRRRWEPTEEFLVRISHIVGKRSTFGFETHSHFCQLIVFFLIISLSERLFNECGTRPGKWQIDWQSRLGEKSKNYFRKSKRTDLD